MSIEVGSVLEGVVTGITNFGAFIELPGGQVGLVHISEVADVYVHDVKNFLKEQDIVKVKVVAIDARGKIGLSIKQTQAPVPKKPPVADNNRRPVNKISHVSFEDKINKFLKDSDERLSDLKRNTESKRSGRGAVRRAE